MSLQHLQKRQTRKALMHKAFKKYKNNAKTKPLDIQGLILAGYAIFIFSGHKKSAPISQGARLGDFQAKIAK